MEETSSQAPETVQEKPKTRKGVKIFLIVAVVVLLLLAGLIAWLSFGKPSSLQTKAYELLPYPAAFVDGKPILVKEVLRRYDIAKKTLPQGTGLSDEDLKQQVFDRLVNEEKLSILARSKGVGIKDSEIQDQYNDAVQQLTQGNEDQFKQMLDQYGMTQNDFKQQVLKPDALMSKLVVWYNNQRSLNKEAYDKMDGIEEQIKNGTSFETLASSTSEDTANQGMEGDLGTVDISKLLPEFKSALTGANVGDMKLVASRYGLHLLKVEDKDPQDPNKVHLKQIFVGSNGFEQWYDDAVKNYSVKKTVKI